MTDEILRQFPWLTESQRASFEALMEIYPRLNAGVNVISRKDIGNLEVNHILHSLAIARFISFADGSRVLDLGTGGGFPGIPLAILFPDVEFRLIDRVGKKIRVARQAAEAAGLKNVTFYHGDSGEDHNLYDFVVSRAVMPQGALVKAVRKNISPQSRNSIPNGLISLKGGDLSEELRGLEKRTEIIPVSRYFPLPEFETKKIVYTKID